MKTNSKTTDNNASETNKEIPMESAIKTKKTKQITAEEIQQKLKKAGHRVSILSPNLLAWDRGFISFGYHDSSKKPHAYIYAHIDIPIVNAILGCHLGRILKSAYVMAEAIYFDEDKPEMIFNVSSEVETYDIAHATNDKGEGDLSVQYDTNLDESYDAQLFLKYLQEKSENITQETAGAEIELQQA